MKTTLINFFKEMKQDWKWAKEYGDFSYHLKECFYYNTYFWWIPKKEDRYFGPDFMWYDGPHYSFGFWFFNFSSSYVPPKKKEEMPNSVDFISSNYFKRKVKQIKNFLTKKI